MTPNTEVSSKYYIYWGATSLTLVTWMLALVATVQGAWLELEGELSFFAVGNACFSEDGCGLLNGASACQIIAILIVSVALMVAIASAFAVPPAVEKQGLALGILLAVYAVFQMIAFSLMATFAEKDNHTISTGSLPTSAIGIPSGPFGDDSTSPSSPSGYPIDVEPGATLGVAATGFALGLLGSIVILVLRSSVADHDGPFRVCVGQSGGGAGAATTQQAPASQKDKAGSPPGFYDA